MMGLWEISNKIDEVSYKLGSLKNVAEILAERMCSEPESGAIWAVTEMIEVQEEALLKLSEEIMELHRKIKETSTVKKEKKK